MLQFSLPWQVLSSGAKTRHPLASIRTQETRIRRPTTPTVYLSPMPVIRMAAPRFARKGTIAASRIQSKRRAPTPCRIQRTKRQRGNRAAPNRTSTAPSITRTSSNSLSTWDGCPSTFHFPLMSSRAIPMNCTPFAIRWCPSRRLCDGIWTTSEAL